MAEANKKCLTQCIIDLQLLLALRMMMKIEREALILYLTLIPSKITCSTTGIEYLLDTAMEQAIKAMSRVLTTKERLFI